MPRKVNPTPARRPGRVWQWLTRCWRGSACRTIRAFLVRWSLPSLVLSAIAFARPADVDRVLDWQKVQGLFLLSLTFLIAFEVLAWRDRRMANAGGFFKRAIWPQLKRGNMAVAVWLAAFCLGVFYVLGQWIAS